MRTLCLYLPPGTTPLAAEHFLRFSPRVHYRAPGIVFLDIASTTRLFGGEQKLLDEARLTAQRLGQATDAEALPAAISDTPWGAQVLAQESPGYISLPTQEIGDLVSLPLARLHAMEGLVAWRSNDEIERIVDFFHHLGIRRLGEIRRFGADAFRARWPEMGTLIWKRLHGLDRQVISPLLPTEALVEYVHLDFPLSLLPFLLHRLEKALGRLIGRLQGRGEYAQKIIISLFCEYSERIHIVELQPASPGRNLDLFMKLLEHKLAPLDFDNPIRQIEIEAIPCPEKLQQLSFFGPQVSEQEKLSELVSVFNQAELTTGFLRPRDEVMPENAWEITPEYKAYAAVEDEVEIEGQSFRVRPAYAFPLAQAPRPSRLLKKPRLLGSEVERFRVLSQQPIERLEENWWETSASRDYYFGLSPKGQFVWLFYDRIEQQYYLHGYFD